MGQYGATGGLSSTCWFNEWMTMMSAKLQPTLMGTPRMTGNWSGHTADAATWQGCAAVVYPSSAYASSKAPASAQDRVGGTSSLLVYVDGTHGNDNTGTGIITSPFSTLARALQLTRTVSGSKTILFQAGSYYFSQTLYLTGAVDSQLTLMAVPGQDVVFVGGVNVATSWTQHSTNIYVTSLPTSTLNMSWAALNEVFNGNTRLTRARWPNGDPWDPLDVLTHWSVYAWRGQGLLGSPANIQIPHRSYQPNVGSGRTGGVYPAYSGFSMQYGGLNSRFSPQQSWFYGNVPGGIQVVNLFGFQFSANWPNWINPHNTYWHQLQGNGWGSQSYQFDSFNVAAGNATFLVGGWQEGRGCDDNGGDTVAGGQCNEINLGYVDHQFAELDTTNEYYIDAANGLLYLWSSSGVGSLPSTLEVSQVPTMIWIQNTSFVTIQGITIQHTSNAFMAPFSAFGGGDWTGTFEAAIRISNCQNCTVANCLLTQLGGNAIVVGGASNGTFIGYNEITHIGGNGVSVLGDILSYDASVEWYQPRWTTIQSNLIQSVGHLVKESGAVFVAQSYSVLIDGNAMMVGPRSGVNMQDVFGGGKVLSNNVMLSWSMETNDVGPVNTWGRNSYYAWNQDIGAWSFSQAVSFVHDNLIMCDYLCQGGINAQALDYDDGTDRITTYHNVVMMSRTKWHQASNLNYTNNLIFGVGGQASAVIGTDSQVTTTSHFNGNTFWGPLWAPGATSYYNTPTSLTPPGFAGVPTSSNNAYLIPPSLDMSFYYAPINNAPLTLAQYQSQYATSNAAIAEQGSTLGTFPTQYPYHRFWGMNFLVLALSNMYDQTVVTTLPTIIRENMAVQPGTTFTDSFGLVWNPSVSCTIGAQSYGNLAVSVLAWPPYATPVANAPSNNNFLYSSMGYTTFCAFNLQAGTYQLTWLAADYSTGRQPFNVTVQGTQWLTNIQVFVIAAGYNKYVNSVQDGIVVGSNHQLIVEFITTGNNNGVHTGWQIQPTGTLNNYPAGHGA